MPFVSCEVTVEEGGWLSFSPPLVALPPRAGEDAAVRRREKEPTFKKRGRHLE